ncbi:General transcription factor IIE subunit 2 [Hypsibius exemplaris]|uniref:Transcription initiation factor IIE subunit beta n=1 Tax=Hypsibius exemplaris TaxID=2072580 RepID=A0A1W0X7D7_HYPEX|nr:General transcription factor IIE subunit 2 [Hypsibius exemplaris]
MDPSLLREREAFKRKALSQPTVEKRKPLPASQYDRPYEPESSSSSSRKQKPTLPSKSSDNASGGFDYKNVQQSSTVRFAVLGKIIKFMRARHLQGDDYALSVNEILDETKQEAVAPKIRSWLTLEALTQNPKLRCESGRTPELNKFIYKPSFDIRDKKGLLRLLQDHHVKGAGGILMDDIEESLPHASKVMEELSSSIIVIKRPYDKRQVVFFRDPSVAVDMPEDISKLWRSVSVDGMDAKKIADYLSKSGFSFIKNDQRPLGATKKRGRKGARDGKVVLKNNDHVKDILQDYSSKVPK